MTFSGMFFSCIKRKIILSMSNPLELFGSHRFKDISLLPKSFNASLKKNFKSLKVKLEYFFLICCICVAFFQMLCDIYIFSSQEIIPWAKSRILLYWRLRRLLLQNRIKADILSVKPSLSDGEVESMLRRWFVEEHGAVNVSINYKYY